MRTLAAVLTVLTIAAPLKATEAPRFVNESERRLPVAYAVDVVVVGGSTGAVAAAVAAAADGARVFLAAPRPYLGDDMTATLRLHLEEGEKPEDPLAVKLFSERRKTSTVADPARLVPFTYTADLPSAAPHPDTKTPSRLADGRWGSAASESVQYDGNVTVIADAGRVEDLERVHIMAYHRRDFALARITVHTSLEKKTWEKAGAITAFGPTQGSDTGKALGFAVPIERRARYVKFSVEKRGTSKRVLLGEIALVRAGEAPAAPKPERIPPARPLHIKRVLDEALIAAGVEFLYSCFPTDVVRDASGQVCGIVMANRAGRQAVLAKVVVDATERASVARLAEASFRPFPAGTYEVKRVVIGGELLSGDGVRGRTIEPPFERAGRRHQINEYTLRLPFAGGDYAARAVAEQKARDLTYHPDQQFSSDILFQVPPDPVRSEVRVSGPWSGADALDLRACVPAGMPQLYILGGCADVPRDHAAKLLRPLALMRLGSRIGTAAAAAAKGRAAPSGARVPGRKKASPVPGDVREILTGVRPIQELPTIPQEARSLPVLGRYDVVVIGGGTGGAPAGIGAARRGARTLVVEYLHGLGGVGTQGAISSYYWGNRVGFTAEVPGGTSWAIEQKAEWWRTALREAGGHLWFGTMGCGAFVERNRVRGAVVATPQGRGVVLAHVVIDSTGNADIAAAAGVPCYDTDAVDVAVQGTGLPPRQLGRNYTNTDFTIVDETDMKDVWHVLVYAKQMAGDAFDMGKLLDTRERRRIIGDVTLTILDQVNGRTWRDTVVECWSDFDTHGYTTDPYFTLQHPPKRQGYRTHVPYRALLPRDLDGILVTGLGISVHRDAVPLVRMQPDVQNQGYAAGVAAAMAAREKTTTRGIDIRTVQKHLVSIGNLPEGVLTEKDAGAVSLDRLRSAVEHVKDDFKGVAVILAQPEEALPLLRSAYAAATTEKDRLVYARILAVLGDAAGLETILAAIRAIPELDEGWRYRGMGQFGHNMSPLDKLIYAAGRTGDRRALPPILEKVKLLEANSEFSHFRAVALALERIGDPAAAAPLAELLSRPGIGGHATTTIEAALERAKKWPSWTATQPRSDALRELMLGRALFRCGDKNGLGRKTLEAYTKDLRGHLSRHADGVLKGPER
jgi:hypothetical protein